MRRAALTVVAPSLAVLLLAACSDGAPGDEPTGGDPSDTGAADAVGDGASGAGESTQAPSGPRVVRDVPYVDDPAPNQRLDVHVPAGEGPHPVLVWVHGGGWLGGDRAADDDVWETYGDRYAVVSVGYRFAPAATWPAQGDDVLAALDLVRREADEYGLDADRVAVAGMSAGGQLAAWAGLQPSSDVDGVLVFAGPTVLDDPSLADDALDVGVVALLLGCLPTADDCQEVAADASPRTWVGPDAPAVFVQHGEADRVVPVDVARAFEAALVESGADPATEYVPGLGHEYVLSPAVDAFLDEVLG